MINVLVTGANGFIGTHLVAGLKEHGYTYFPASRKDGDTSFSATWESFPDAEVVVHLAARSFVPDSWNDIAGFMQCNLNGTIEALNYCKARGAKLVYLSSYMYGNPASLPISEDAQVAVNNPYALTKRLAEETCKFYAESFGIPVTILRPFNVYGPGQAEQFLVPSLIRQVKKGDAIRVKDLEPKRDYLYVSDLVKAIILSVGHSANYEILNIGSGTSYSVKELIDIIQAHSHTGLPVFSDAERRKNEVMDTVADISRAQKVISWLPEWPLSRGIEEILRQQS